VTHLARAADWILSGIGTGLILFVVYLTTTYGLAPHYVMLGLIGLGFVATRWLNLAAKINLALVVLFSLLSLYAGELLLAVTASARENFERNRWLTFPNDATPESTQARLKENSTAQPAFDRRDKLQVIADLEREGRTAYPAVVPHAVLKWDNPDAMKTLRALSIDGEETLPLGGVADVLTVFCNESGEYVTYHSDERGFHNPPDVWNDDRPAVVAVGDSFTHGACVPTEDSFVGVIRARHPQTINLGMDSNGPLMMLASLKEYGARVRPKTVLWFYYEGNDLKDLVHERHSPLLRRYLTGGYLQSLWDRQDKLDQALKAYIEQTRQSLGVRIGVEETIKLHHVRQIFTRWYAGQQEVDVRRASELYFSAEVTDEEMQQFRDVLVKAMATVHGWGGELHFVYLPQWARYAKPEAANKNRERVLRLVADLKLPLIDIHQVFARQTDPVGLFPFRRSNHYNVQGHRLVGEEVLRVLHENGAVAPSKRS
jgi:hypothetical protein